MLILGLRDDATSCRCQSSDSSIVSSDLDCGAFLDAVQRAERAIEIPVRNLPFSALNEWLASLLSTNDLERTLPLSRIVYSKTAGNPHFVLTYLEKLQREKRLSYRYATQTWTWNVTDIQKSDAERKTEPFLNCKPRMMNVRSYSPVEELVARQIAGLPRLTQQLLQVASCLGFQFDETLLKSLLQNCDSLLLLGFSHATALVRMSVDMNDDSSAASNLQEEEDVDEAIANETYLSALYQAEELGLIRSSRDPSIFEFTHDKVRQTVRTPIAVPLLEF
jgi:hypothetical protein